MMRVMSGPDRELAGRLSGAVWGALIGDAVGVPYEFGPPCLPTASNSGAPGRMAAARHVERRRRHCCSRSSTRSSTVGFDPEDQGASYLAWADDGDYTPDGDGRFDIGNATADSARAHPQRGRCGDGRRRRDGARQRVAHADAADRTRRSRSRARRLLIDQASRASAVTHAADAARLRRARCTSSSPSISCAARRTDAAVLAVGDWRRCGRATTSDGETLALIDGWPTREWSRATSSTRSGRHGTRSRARRRTGRPSLAPSPTGTTRTRRRASPAGSPGRTGGSTASRREWQGRMRDRDQVAAAMDRLRRAPRLADVEQSPACGSITVDLSGVPGVGGRRGHAGHDVPAGQAQSTAGRGRGGATSTRTATRCGRSTASMLCCCSSRTTSSRTATSPTSPNACRATTTSRSSGSRSSDVDVPTDPVAYRATLTDVLARIKGGETVAVAAEAGSGGPGRRSLACW